ncbi:MAG: type II secretion system minor pseudopilin GspK [Alphaproteobacteria bacterium]|nr:type II secretion system minor pseudopilin GspK [Alphaproteobacteria bacterium]
MRHVPHPSRGAVLLLALLLTALVATLVSTALWRQSGLIRIETAERQRQQAQWLLLGATDWARLILREDARSGNADHLSEPWAVPLHESRLSSFLAAQPGLADSGIDIDLADQVWLSGAITDAQGKFNLNNLFQGQQVDPKAQDQWVRLFGLLGLPEDQAASLLQTLARTKEEPPNLFWPRSLDDLAVWGLSPETIERLRPHVSVLPERSILNVNTATPEVLAAVIDGMGLSQAQSLVQARQRSPWIQPYQARRAIGSGWDDGRHGINSSFFEVSGVLRMNAATLSQTTLVKREGGSVQILWSLPQGNPTRP